MTLAERRVPDRAGVDVHDDDHGQGRPAPRRRTSISRCRPASTVGPARLRSTASTLADPTVSRQQPATRPSAHSPRACTTATLGTRAGVGARPGNRNGEGTATAGSTADTATARSSKTVTVVESFENGGTATCGDFGAMRHHDDAARHALPRAHLDGDRSRHLPVHVARDTGPKTAASIFLGNLPADYDLVLVRAAPALLRNPPQQSLQPVNDTALSLTRGRAHLSPDTVQDVPLTPPAYAPGVVQVAANRGRADEQIDTGSLAPGDYASRSRATTARSSPKPFSLRMTLDRQHPARSARRRRSPNSATPVRSPRSATLGPEPARAVPRAAAPPVPDLRRDRADPLIDQAPGARARCRRDDPRGRQRRYAVAREVRRVGREPLLGPTAANDVVREIGKQIDAARAANPNHRRDRARRRRQPAPDGARARPHGDRATSARYARLGDQRVVRRHHVASTTSSPSRLDRRLLLTDDAYGTAARHLGRTSTSCSCPTSRSVGSSRRPRTSPPRSTRSSTNTRHARPVDRELGARHRIRLHDRRRARRRCRRSPRTARPSTLAHQRLVVGHDLHEQAARRHGARYREPQHPLRPVAPARRQRHDLREQLGRSAELTDPAHRGDLARRLLSRWGVTPASRSPTSRSAAQLDWAQAITGAKQGGLFAGNTGYGLGDDATVALAERLMALYAQALDGTVSAGAALMIAKQQYLATTQVLTPYDEKVLQQVVFYGLPMYSLGVGRSRRRTRACRRSASRRPPSTDARGQRDDQRHRPAYGPAGRAVHCPQRPESPTPHNTPQRLVLRRQRRDDHGAVPADRAGDVGRRHADGRLTSAPTAC